MSNPALTNANIRDIDGAIRRFGDCDAHVVFACKMALESLKDRGDWHTNKDRVTDCKEACTSILDILDGDNSHAALQYSSGVAKELRAGDSVSSVFVSLARTLLESESSAEKQATPCLGEVLVAVRLMCQILTTRLAVVTVEDLDQKTDGLTSKDARDLEQSISFLEASTYREDAVARSLCDLINRMKDGTFFYDFSDGDKRIISEMLGMVLEFFDDPDIRDPGVFVNKGRVVDDFIETKCNRRTEDAGYIARGMIIGRSEEESRAARPLFDKFIAAIRLVKHLVDNRYVSDARPSSSIDPLQIPLRNLRVESNETPSDTEDHFMGDVDNDDTEIKSAPKSAPKHSVSSSSSAYRAPRSRPREARSRGSRPPPKQLLVVIRMSLQRIALKLANMEKQLTSIHVTAKGNPDYAIVGNLADCCNYAKQFFHGMEFTLDSFVASQYRSDIDWCVRAADALKDKKPKDPLPTKHFSLSDHAFGDKKALWQLMENACSEMTQGIIKCKSMDEIIHIAIHRIAERIFTGFSLAEKKH